MDVNANTHPNRDQLAAYGLGKLDDAETAAVAEHLESCNACQQTVEETPPDTFVHVLQAARPASEPGLPPELANHPRFRIVCELGRGGMGVVYLAEHRLMQRQVAIKVVSKSLVENPEALERFHREVRAAAKLDHENIVRAYDAEQAGGLHMLVMEYVEGLNLAQELDRRGALPVAESCHYIRQAARALQHAFDKGMVHRDLKPQNLMLLPDKGRIKVLDFGLARLASERQPGMALTVENTVMGTPEYIAPEQVIDARQADIRADIYSLGCTLYCLLSGRPPFVEQTAMGTILAHRDKQAVPLPQVRSDVPADLWAVVARMIAKDPGQRYQTPGEAAEALAPFCKQGRESTAAGTASPPENIAVATVALTEEKRRQLRPSPGRRPWRRVGLTAVAAVIGLGLVTTTIWHFSTKEATIHSAENNLKAMVEVDGAIKACKRFFYPNARYHDLPPRPISLDEFGRQHHLIMEWCDANAPHYVAPLRKVLAIFLQDPQLVNSLARGSPIPAEAALAIREADDVYNAISKRLVKAEFLCDMQEFDLQVAEGPPDVPRFAKKGNLGLGEGDPRYDFGHIRVNGERSPNGLFMNPNERDSATVKYRLAKTAHTFLASVALDDSAGGAGLPPGVGRIPTALTFQVLGDGKLLWQSQPVDIARKVQECKVDVSGVDVLELRVDCPGSGENAYAVWLEPRVLLK